MKSLINDLNLLPEVALSLFRIFFIPIGTYGSEIWSAFCNFDLYKAADNLLFKWVQMSFGKYVLGVNKKKTFNNGVRGELELYSVQLKIMINVVKYACRLFARGQSS